MIRIIEAMIGVVFCLAIVATAGAHMIYLRAERQGVFNTTSNHKHIMYKTKYYMLGSVAECLYAVDACLAAFRLLVVGAVWAVVCAALFMLVSYTMIAFAHAMAKAAIVWRDSQRDTTHLDSAS